MAADAIRDIMYHHDLHLPRIVVLVVLAIALGSGVLWLDRGRQADAAPLPAATAGVADPVARATGASSTGALVSNAAATTAPAAAPNVPGTAPAPSSTPTAVELRGGVPCATPHRTVEVTRDLAVRAAPNGAVVGTVPMQSRFLGQSMRAWVQAVSTDGLWGKITVPWSKPVGTSGWIPLTGLAGRTTSTMVVADLSERRMHVYNGCRELFSVGTAIGRPGSPSPTGRFWVTDRVPVPAAQRGSFGTFAFGLSTVQPHLPPGWHGGDQMAIHGTGAPGSIGQAASAGCLRVGEDALTRLRPLLRSGTPVVIQA
jgi:lipoprotein-anchoring transpeptidase ErfK/SrfK